MNRAINAMVPGRRDDQFRIAVVNLERVLSAYLPCLFTEGTAKRTLRLVTDLKRLAASTLTRATDIPAASPDIRVCVKNVGVSESWLVEHIAGLRLPQSDAKRAGRNSRCLTASGSRLWFAGDEDPFEAGPVRGVVHIDQYVPGRPQRTLDLGPRPEVPGRVRDQRRPGGSEDIGPPAAHIVTPHLGHLQPGLDTAAATDIQLAVGGS